MVSDEANCVAVTRFFIKFNIDNFVECDIFSYIISPSAISDYIISLHLSLVKQRII